MKNQKGFTLLEVLIAITILSFIMLGVIAVSTSTQNTAERVINEDKENLQIETALSRIDWDFSHIYSPLYFSHKMKPGKLDEKGKAAAAQIKANYQGNVRFKSLSYDAIPIPTYKNEGKNELIFFTSSNRRKLQNLKQSNYAWVRYSLEADETEDDEGEKIGGNKLIRQFMPHDSFSSEKYVFMDALKVSQEAMEHLGENAAAKENAQLLQGCKDYLDLSGFIVVAWRLLVAAKAAQDKLATAEREDEKHTFLVR